MSDAPTERFTERVAAYVSYRPSYPAGVIELLQRECGLSESAIVADVGSGTGIFTRQLVPYAGRVYAVEPNDAMREAAEGAGFVSVHGTAEATGLPDESVDLVTCAQSFHWFDPIRTRAEFTRILRPGGYVALVWNERLEKGSPFLVDYEAFLRRYCPAYLEVGHRELGQQIMCEFFAPSEMKVASFPNEQLLDEEGLIGRVLSSSYSPKASSPDRDAFVGELRQLFASHQVEDVVRFEYETQVYFGRLE